MGLLNSVIGAYNFLYPTYVLGPLKRAYNFELRLASAIDGIEGLEVSKYCQDIKFGQYNMSDISTMRVGAHKASYAGKLDIETVTLTFLSPNNSLVERYFDGWRKLIVDDEGFYSPKDKYKKDVYIEMKSTTPFSTIGWRLSGCFPQTFPSYNLSYGSEEMIRYDIILNVDMIEPKYK